MHSSPEPCSCSCSYLQALGWYSSQGWHMRRITQAEADADELLTNYVGTPVAVERCPAYDAVAARAHAARQAEQAAQTNRPGRLRA